MRLVQSPYADDALRHPLFWLDVRRVRWGQTVERFRRYSRNIFLVVNSAVLFIWLFLLMAAWAGDPYDRSSLVYVESFNILNFIAVIAIAVDAVLDFVCLQTALNAINGEIVAGRWDLLRLTALHERGIARAKHAATRLRVWRLTLVVASVRAATILLALVGLLALPYIFTGYNRVVDGLFDTLIYDPISSFLAYTIAAITALVYIVEPFWRMQAMTALGMVLSAYIRSTAFGLLAAVGTMVMVWLLQLTIAVVLALGLSMGLSVVLAPLIFGVGVGSSAATAFMLLVACIITAFTIYGFYALLQTWSLERVVQRINKAN